MACALVACDDDDDKVMTQTPVTLRSQSIAEGASVLAGTTTQLTLSYNYHMAINDAVNVTVNGTNVTPVIDAADVKNVIIPLALNAGVDYTISVPEGAFYNNDNVTMTSEALTINFSTEAGLDKSTVATTLVNDNATPQAVNVYNFLLENYTAKTLSGVMANVANNNDFSDLVYSTTGKYPALTGYDFIHLSYSPNDWINYGDITPAQTQWDNNGLVTYMWHWNTPTNEGDDISTYSANSDFDIEAALTEGTWQHDFIMNDIAKVAGYLKQLQDAGIPVIWRPLHEAAGNYDLYGSMEEGAWFWWGGDGAQAYKDLWIYVFNYMKDEGLKNLIWVWTSQTSSYADIDSEFYPGDQYVDIIGRDTYNGTDASGMASQYEAITQTFTTKMAALSECGNVPDMAAQWSAGAKWLFFMPWYDSENDYSEGFVHEHADIAWWKATFASDAVITRDELPGSLFD